MNKDTILRTRISKTEAQIIKKKAELLNISVSEYIRQTCLNKHVKGFSTSDINKQDEQIKGQLNISDII